MRSGKLSAWDWFVGILVLVVATVVIILGIYNNAKYMGYRNRCSETIAVGITDSNVEQYLYAPYHGGVVKTLYTHSTNYDYDINGKEYTLYLSYKGIAHDSNVCPSIVIVHYNPNNPEEQYVIREEIEDVTFIYSWYMSAQYSNMFDHK